MSKDRQISTKQNATRYFTSILPSTIKSRSPPLHEPCSLCISGATTCTRTRTGARTSRRHGTVLGSASYLTCRGARQIDRLSFGNWALAVHTRDRRYAEDNAVWMNAEPCVWRAGAWHNRCGICVAANVGGAGSTCRKAGRRSVK